MTQHIDLNKLDLVFSKEDGTRVYCSVTELTDSGMPIDPDTGDDLELVGAFLHTEKDARNQGKGLVITGNPFDGYEIYGPCRSVDYAKDAADRDPHLDGDWWVAPLHAMTVATEAIEPNEDYPDEAVIVTGNPVQGFMFYGPFPSLDHATVAGNQATNLGVDWYVARIYVMTEDKPAMI